MINNNWRMGADNVVTNKKLKDMPEGTIKGRISTGEGDPEDLTVDQVVSMLDLGGVGTGTKAQFNTACTDGDFLFVGDITSYTDEQAQDAVGAMVDSTLVYVDGTPLLTRAALTGDVTASQSSNSTTIGNDVVSNAKLSNMPASTIKGNNTGSSADPIDLTVSQTKTLLAITSSDVSGLGTLATQNGTFSGTSSGTNTGDQTITLTQDVTGSGTGSFATTIANNAVTNAKLNDMATQTFKGRTTAGTGDPEDLTVAQAKTMLNLNGTNSGDQTITLTGDVTGSGTGSFAATIANDVVTYAKIQNVTTNKLLGRATAGSGDTEEITLGTNLVFVGTTLNASTGISQTEIDFGSIPVSDATFTVTDAGVSGTSQIIAQVAWEAPTGKDIDEIEMDNLEIRCQPGTGQFTMFINSADGSYLADKFKINYLVG